MVLFSKKIQDEGGRTFELKTVIETFLYLNHSPAIYDSIAIGLLACPFLDIFSWNSEACLPLFKIDFRPLLYSLIDQCNLVTLHRLFQRGIFDCKLENDLSDHYKKKLGALLMFCNSSGFDLPMSKFLACNIFKDDLWEPFSRYGFHKILNYHIVANASPEILKQYLDPFIEKYGSKTFEVDKKDENSSHHKLSFINQKQRILDLLKSGDPPEIQSACKSKKFNLNFVCYLTRKAHFKSSTAALSELVALKKPVKYVDGKRLFHSLIRLHGELQKNDLETFEFRFAELNTYCLTWFGYSYWDTLIHLNDEYFCQLYNLKQFKSFFEIYLKANENQEII